MWLQEEVIFFTETYTRKKNDFKNLKFRNKDIWCDVSHEMLAHVHVSCDAKSCETKFKNLKKAYTACIDRNKKTGDDTKKCAYYEELQHIP